MITKNQLLLISFFSILILKAEIKVASVLGDNMVLQRNTEVKLWGKATPGTKLAIKTNWNNATYNLDVNDNGDWLVKVRTTEAGGPYSITIKSENEKVMLKNILLGEVWICSGQSNMQMPIMGFAGAPINGAFDILLNSKNDNIRLFSVARNSSKIPIDNCGGKWLEADAQSVGKFSAVAYLYAKQLNQVLHIPIGVISTTWGGSPVEAWINDETMKQFPETFKQRTLKNTKPFQRQSALYNGMIVPLLNYSFKGVIWYQGEANVPNYYEYATMLQSMIANWRKDFGIGDFPFYFVQIAPFSYKDSKGITSALQRSEQEKAGSLIENSGMVSTIDLGEENNIHPAEKNTVAKRLACLALAETYNIKGLPHRMPTFKEMAIKDSVAIVSFNNEQSGLTSYGKEVECFQIAGNDSIFYPAKVKVRQQQVVVQSAQVKNPVAVRYAFTNFPKTSGYLYNNLGLPISSFRTDNWNK